jgi:hypothetical protein
MAARKLHDPPFSVLVETGNWYWGAVCLNTSAIPYPDKTSVFSNRCIHCSHVGHYPSNTIRGFRGE